jgi:hypothetical protein
VNRAEVAQLVEHSPEKAGVDSSILSLGTTSHFPLQTDCHQPGLLRARMGAELFLLEKSREVERGDSHGRRNIEGLYVTAKRDGESSAGLRTSLC